MKIELFGKILECSGLIVGLVTFIIIMFGHWACIVCEYYFTKKSWVAFLLCGLALCIVSLSCENDIIGACFSICGFTMLWGIGEVIEQEKRVEKGWFPKNPKRKK